MSLDFLLQVFFHESPSPKPLKITLGTFRIFGKFAEIFASQGAPPINYTSGNFATGTAALVHLKLRISLRILEKIRNSLNEILKDLGKTNK